MSKVKINEVAREMQQTAGELLGDVQVSRQRATAYVTGLRRLEEHILQAEARAYEEQRRREEEASEALQSAHEETAPVAETPVQERETAAPPAASEKKRAEKPKKAEPPIDAQPAAASAEQPKPSAEAQGVASVAKDAPAGEAAAAKAPTKETVDKAELIKEAFVAEVVGKVTAKDEAIKPSVEKAQMPEKAVPEKAETAAQAEAPQPRPVQPKPVEPVRPQAAQTPRPAQPKPAGQQGDQRPRPNLAPGPRPPVAGRPPMAGVPGPRPPVPGLAPRPITPRQPVRPANAPGAPAAQGGPRPPMAGGQGGFRPPTPGMGPRPQQGGAPRPGGAPGAGPRPGGFGGRPGAGRKPEPIAPAQEKERVSNYDPNKSMYDRKPENDKKPRPKKAMTKDAPPIPMDDDDIRGGKRRPRKQQAQRIMPQPVKIEKAFMTAETITVKDLTERIGVTGGEIVKKLFLLGIMATINQEIDFDTAQLVSQEYGVELILKMEKTAEETLIDEDFTDKEEDLIRRSPVVTIMGHVDHGKTSLLDYIRKASVVTGEAGGITQHIGAYTIEINGQSITFLDTPGHEAFTAMRARGAQATDIAVLVVAADDGIMPQTVEAINHAKAAGVPIVVAINKMDKPTANPDRIRQELTQFELVDEQWGGETIIVPVSALSGDGVDKLLEMILLQAEVLQLSANPNRLAKGVIIEAQLDKGRGPVATVLVQNGTLKTGDTIVAGQAYGRVRAMVDDKGVRVTTAGPSTPVEVMGFGEVPDAGDTVYAVEDDKLSRMVAEERRLKQQAEKAKMSSRTSLDDFFQQMGEGVKDLNIVIKGDVQGSVEAIRQAMEKLTNEEVRIKVVHAGVGAISVQDVMLAATANAIIIGFNVRPDANARTAIEAEKIDARMYRVIYQAIEDIEKAMKGLLSPEYKENILGHAEVRQVFRVTGSGTIAGCMIIDGVVRRNAQVRLLRDNVVVYEGKLDSLKRFKDDAREVATGYECGIGLENYNDIKERDVIECFEMELIER